MAQKPPKRRRAYKNEVMFHARLHAENDADVVSAIQEMRSKGMTDRQILVTAMNLGVLGRDLDELAEIHAPAGALRRMIENVLRKLNLATSDDIELLSSEFQTALSNVNVTVAQGERGTERGAGRTSNELLSMLSDFTEEEG